MVSIIFASYYISILGFKVNRVSIRSPFNHAFISFPWDAFCMIHPNILHMQPFIFGTVFKWIFVVVLDLCEGNHRWPVDSLSNRQFLTSSCKGTIFTDRHSLIELLCFLIQLFRFSILVDNSSAQHFHHCHQHISCLMKTDGCRYLSTVVYNAKGNVSWEWWFVGHPPEYINDAIGGVLNGVSVGHQCNVAPSTPKW